MPKWANLCCQTHNCLFLFNGPREKRRGRPKKYDGKVNFQDLKRFDDVGTIADNEDIHLYTAIVWHVSLKRKLRIMVLLNLSEPLKPRYVVLACTDILLDAVKILELYKLRFQIEFLFRDAKQFTGLNDCQARAQSVLDFHFNASLATVNLARAEQLLTQPCLTQVFSLASFKQRYFNQHF